ncbi:hypothetical protein [Pedococcus sp. 5OH_020]|nr:hypothetical protein [Pedococcus sp. 5OH_020]
MATDKGAGHLFYSLALTEVAAALRVVPKWWCVSAQQAGLRPAGYPA